MATTIRQLSVFIENKTGSLVRITGILSDAGIDIRTLSLADTADFGVLRLIVDHPNAAIQALKDEECIVSSNEVIAVPIADAPGSLHHVLSVLNENDLFIEYSYAFLTRKTNSAYVVFRLDDNDKAERVLAEAGIALTAADELFRL